MLRHRPLLALLLALATLGAVVFGSGAAVAGPTVGMVGGPTVGMVGGPTVGMVGRGPTSSTVGPRTLGVDESTNLPTSGLTLTVTGSGFDPAVDVYVAICAASITQADDLTYCVGGLVPAENSSRSWAVVSANPTGQTNGVPLAADGSFTTQLIVDAAVGASVDCVSEGCVLIARSIADPATRPADITVGLSFVAPATTSDVPSTVTPDAVALPEAVVGDQQTVVFSGFTPGEAVAVTVFSDPIQIPDITASASGVVTITFRIDSVLLPGTHTVQAIGGTSRLIGLAEFTVVVPVASTTSAAESSTSATTTSSTSSSAPSSTTSASASPSAATTTSALPVTPTTPSDSGSLWWLWATLALIVVVGGITGAVALSRRRAQQLEQERLDRDAQLAAAAPPAPSAQVWPPQQPSQGGYQPHDPNQSHGLLSGQTGDGPALYSGQHIPPPAPIPPATRYEEPTRRIRPTPPTGQPGPAFTGDPTTALPPAGIPDSGPGTETWSPFHDDPGDGSRPPR